MRYLRASRVVALSLPWMVWVGLLLSCTEVMSWTLSYNSYFAWDALEPPREVFFWPTYLYISVIEAVDI